jgi:hypothetical protein
MGRSAPTLLIALLALPVLWARAAPQQRATPKKHPDPAFLSKSTGSPAKPVEAKRSYNELTIRELVLEDPNRWTENMATRVAVGGFVTNVTREPQGDVSIRICDNPKVEGMDRTRCIETKCIPSLPCELPQVGMPINVKGITRYDAAVGDHWWEINPIEQIEK